MLSWRGEFYVPGRDKTGDTSDDGGLLPGGVVPLAGLAALVPAYALRRRVG